MQNLWDILHWETNVFTMELSRWKYGQWAFHVTCILGTVSLQIYCLFRYFWDEDLSSVQYTPFHSHMDAIYPSFSFCFVPPFLENAFEIYEDGINITTYSKFLHGELWDERMLAVDYDNVTVSMKGHLILSKIRFQNKSIIDWTSQTQFHVSFRSATRKCFTLNVPYMEHRLIWDIQLYMKNTMFPHGRRPDPSDNLDFYTYFHYPGQRFTTYSTIKYYWNSRANKKSSYMMAFELKNMDVTSHRNKRREPCIPNWRSHDQMIMDDMMLTTGCRPPFWNTSLELNLCINGSQMKNFADQPSPSKVNTYHPPCQSIERLDYDYREYNWRYIYFTFLGYT